MAALKKRFTSNLGGLMRKRSSQDVNVDTNTDSPEANAARGVRLFCESGAANSGEEVLHLPTIVESAVASPAAAAAAAQQIRKFLSKENYERPHVQYNAVMLIRILTDNPGQSFTKNLDKQFADTCKHLLRNGQDPSVRQILRESLGALEREKAYDTNLNTLFAMWRKEKGLMERAEKQFGPRPLHAPPWNGQQIQGGFSSGGSRHSSRTLPPAVELAGRIEEARTSAKLLLQLVQSTPPNELLSNELVKEFAERCTSAQRSIHGYIACDNPPPDDDTMLTLIETNEQLSLAASKHQRAVLQARRALGQSMSPPIPPSNNMTPAGVPHQPYDAPHYPPQNHAPVLPPVAAQPTEQNYSPPPNSGYASPSAQNYIPPPDTGYAPPANAPYTPPPQPAPYKNDELPLPPALQAGGGSAPRKAAPSAAQEDDPFADHHTTAYMPPPGAPPSATLSPPSTEHRGSPDSYHPSYTSTPSYLGRQESSVNNLTMHGAVQQKTLTEEEEYARDYPSQQQQQTSRTNQTAQRAAGSDVSPVAERNTVTYRY